MAKLNVYFYINVYVNEFQIRAVHLSSGDNRLADCLSRWDLDSVYNKEFYNLVSHFSPLTDITVSEDLFRFNHDW